MPLRAEPRYATLISATVVLYALRAAKSIDIKVIVGASISEAASGVSMTPGVAQSSLGHRAIKLRNKPQMAFYY